MPWMVVGEETNLVTVVRSHWENLLASPAASDEGEAARAEELAEGASLAATKNRDFALVATDDDVVVGWLLLAAVDDALPNGTCEVLDLAIAPAHQRQGHGSRLMHAAADAARQQHAQWLSMWCPLPDEPRREFLVAHGFAPDGALRDLQTHDGITTLREVRLVAELLEVESTS